jgi:hypothetical protein
MNSRRLRRGVASPEIADALACTFASEVASAGWEGSGDHLVKREYDPFSDDWLRDRPGPAPRIYAPGWARLREDQ